MIRNLLDRMKLPFRKNKEFVRALYDILGFYPHDVNLYRIAFSHRSLGRRSEPIMGKDGKRRFRRPQREEREETKPLNNERLEYLGDAVLETVVSDILFRKFQTKREGFLTSTRSKIVQREALNRLACDMGLDKLILAAHGTKIGHTNIGGNAFEALMGAIYLDRGFHYCHWFIANRVIGRFVDVENVAQKEVNFKSKLLEWSQKNRIQLDFRDKEGERGDRGFSTAILLEKIVIGHGTGRAKKDSQQQAAKDALTRMRRDPKLYESIFTAKEKRTAMEAEESFALPKIDEIEQQLADKQPRRKERTSKMPVLETEKTDTKTDPEAAFAMAYDNEANFEVIDAVEEPVLPTAEDFERLGLPAPPAEDDLLTEKEQTRKDRSRQSTQEEKTDKQEGTPKPTQTAQKVKAKKPEKAITAEDTDKTEKPSRRRREKIVIREPEAVDSGETDTLKESLSEEANTTLALAEQSTIDNPQIIENQPAARQEDKLASIEKTEDFLIEETITSMEATTENAAVYDKEELTTQRESQEAEDSQEAIDEPTEIKEEITTSTDYSEETSCEDSAPSVNLTFTEPTTRPILRHLSIDDIIFDSEHPAVPETDEETLDYERPKERSRRRRRRPTAKNVSKDDTQTENSEASVPERPTRHKGQRVRKTSSAETTEQQETEIIPRQRRNRRRRSNGEKPTSPTEE